MKLEGIEIIRASLTMRETFRTSFGSLQERELLLLKAVTPNAHGWGECVAFSTPMYSAEYLDGAADVLERFLIPPVLAAPTLSAETVGHLLHHVRGHRMAKAALEAAVLDAQLRELGLPFAAYLGAVRDRVPAGVSVGIRETVPELLDTVEEHIAHGYRRIKLKIAPGWDIEPVRAVREKFGASLPLQVDANAAYTLADAAHLARLDDYDLQLIEQPLGEEHLRQHAELARLVRTPIALDESVPSADAAADAIALRACRVINIKPGRVGGYLEARRIHDLCRANGLGVWCGGMAETGIGRAANIALAALPGFIPGDNSASSRYYPADITEPFELDDGHLTIPTGPGFGIDPEPSRLTEIATATRWLAASA